MVHETQNWSNALHETIGSAGLLRRIFVMRETDSTQDAARRMRAVPGDVIVAARQTKGRGRLGRVWEDTGKDGVALTLVLDREEAPQRLAITAAVGIARAAEALLTNPGLRAGERVKIKWPNDVMIGGLKLAGVLIEQIDAIALIGIGMNVSQRAWPEQLRGVAVSLAELDAAVSRLDALQALLRELNDVFTWPHEEVINGFLQRDALRGEVASFRAGGAIITGLVKELDPARGLRVETDDGEVWLPAATTSLVKA